MELVKGRPTDCSGRLEREVRVYDLLDKLGIEYERTDHEEANTMEKCNEIDKILDTIICKNLFLCNRQQTEFYLLMMPGDKPFKTKYITKQLGCSRLSFAPSEKMLEYLDIKPGAVSIMGLMNDSRGDKCFQVLPCPFQALGNSAERSVELQAQCRLFHIRGHIAIPRYT